MRIEDRPQGDCIRSRKEFAQRLGINTRTLDRMEAAGQLPPKVRISERRVGYRESDIATFISTRDSHRDYVRRWFRELEYYGFIRMLSLAHHGLNGHGRAAHYRLTEEPYLGKPPTRDFMNWDGVIFHEQKSPKDYQTKNRSRGPYVRSTLDQTCGPVSDKPAPMNGNSSLDVRSMCEEERGPDVGSIN